MFSIRNLNPSLRLQLSLWIGLVILLIVFVLTLLMQEVAVRNLEKSIDVALQKRAHAVAAVVSLGITQEEESYARVVADLAGRELPFLPLMLRVVSPDGTVIRQFARAPDWVGESMDRQLELPGKPAGRFDSVMEEGMEPLRIYTVSVSDQITGERLAYVQAVETLTPVDRARSLMWLASAVVGLLGGLLGAGAGLVLMWRGFRPLGAIVQAIDNIDYHHLAVPLRKEARPAELRQLAGSLADMWQRLGTAVNEKKEFLARVSHDLRTPLTALQGHIEVLLFQPSLSAEARDSLRRMLRETRRLVRLSGNLLLNLQLESGPVAAAEEVNLRELLDEVVGDMWVLARGLEFNIVAPTDVMVLGDRDLLKEMALNIVDNAIKFTPKGGQIELTLTSEDGWAVFGVSDTGRGIPADQLSHVMEPSYPAARSKGEGARLGLAIVRQITQLHGGHIDIQSQEGVGTSVRVRLPLSEEGLRPPPTGPMSNP